MNDTVYECTKCGNIVTIVNGQLTHSSFNANCFCDCPLQYLKAIDNRCKLPAHEFKDCNDPSMVE